MTLYLNNEPAIKFSDLPNDTKQFITDHYVFINPTDQFYQHKKGGLYWKLYEGELTDDKSAVIIYKHLYPFITGIFVRSKAEFEDGRFKRVIQG